MPLARVVRHSPLYLYLKLYTLSLLVTIFASAPVTGRLNREHLQRIEQIRSVAADTFRRKAAGNDGLPSSSSLAALVAPSEWRAASAGKAAGSPSSHRSRDTPSKPSKRHSKSTSPFPYAIKTLSLDADAAFPALPLRSAYQKTARVVRRWGRRLQDLSRVKGAVHADQHNTKRFPELLMHAQVRLVVVQAQPRQVCALQQLTRRGRCSHGTHPSEQRFVQSRSQHIVESRVLAAMLQGSASTNDADTRTADVRNIPTLAIGGSGGGYRATYGFMSSLAALQSRGVLQATHWLAGVSGSCWTIASLYTVSSLDVGKLIKHCKKVAREGFHPMSRQALDVVARSSKGVYFLLAPLLSKVRSGVVGIGIMVRARLDCWEWRTTFDTRCRTCMPPSPRPTSCSVAPPTPDLGCLARPFSFPRCGIVSACQKDEPRCPSLRRSESSTASKDSKGGGWRSGRRQQTMQGSLLSPHTWTGKRRHSRRDKRLLPVARVWQNTNGGR